MNFYAFGLKKTVPCKTLKQAENVLIRYDKYISYMKHKFPDMVVDYHYEDKITKRNSYHGVHIHGMIKTKNTYKESDLPHEKGMKVYLKPCRCKRAYISYIRKDKTSRQDILDIVKADMEYQDYLKNQPEDTQETELLSDHVFTEKLKTRRIV